MVYILPVDKGSQLRSWVKIFVLHAVFNHETTSILSHPLTVYKYIVYSIPVADSRSSLVSLSAKPASSYNNYRDSIYTCIRHNVTYNQERYNNKTATQLNAIKLSLSILYVATNRKNYIIKKCFCLCVLHPRKRIKMCALYVNISTYQRVPSRKHTKWIQNSSQCFTTRISSALPDFQNTNEIIAPLKRSAGILSNSCAYDISQ